MPQPHDSRPTVVGCPDCAGVLSVRQDNGSRKYECQIGHRYSIFSAVASKEEQLERTLWEAVSLLEHIEILMAELRNDPASRDANGKLAAEADLRQVQAQQQRDQLRQLIEDGKLIKID
jgi:hypothetical protein